LVFGIWCLVFGVWDVRFRPANNLHFHMNLTKHKRRNIKHLLNERELMPARLEIALKDHLIDAEGEGIRQKALNYFGMQLSRVRSVHILTIDANLNSDQFQQIRNEIFTNPVTQISSFEPLGIPFD